MKTLLIPAGPGFFACVFAVSSSAKAQYKCDQPSFARRSTASPWSPDGDHCGLGRVRGDYGLQMKEYVRFEGDETRCARAARTKAETQEPQAIDGASI